MRFLIPFGEKILEWELPFIWNGKTFERLSFSEIVFENGDMIFSINLPEKYFMEVWNGVNFIGVEMYDKDTVTFIEDTDYFDKLAGNNI